MPDAGPNHVHSSQNIDWDTSHFAIVTLWAGRPHAERTLDWLATAEVPPNSALYWLDNSGGKFTARLKADWHEHLRDRYRRLTLIQGGAPYVSKSKMIARDQGRHHHIARLCNRAFATVGEDIVITLEDDIVPPLDGVRSLWRVLKGSDRVGLVSGVYRDRLDPRRIAAALHKQYWRDKPEYESLPPEPFEVGMSGGGFMILTNRALQHALPVRYQKFDKVRASGWDGNLCLDLAAYGYRVMVHPGVRCAHFCPEVLAHEEELKSS